MKHKKLLTALLILLSATILLCSCTTDNGNDDPSSAQSQVNSVDGGSEPQVSAEESTAYTPAVRDVADEIRFLVPSDRYAYYESFEIYAEEQNDEVINNAVYDRNQTVQDLYNCTIRADKSDNVATAMREYINTGLTTYDVYMPMINDAVNLVSEGLMLDLYSLTDLKLDKPWWDQRANEGLEINGKLFFSTGDISILDNECTMVMFFNKTLLSSAGGSENPYQLVEDKEWTLDKVYEISRFNISNLGDENVWNSEDSYGLHCAFNAPHSFYFGCGGTMTEKTADGKLEISINSQKNQSILSKVFELAYKNDILTNKTPGCETFEQCIEMFLNEKVVFTTFALTDLRSFRAVDIDYGILPYPLLDNTQEDYRCLVSTVLVPCVCIPNNCVNPEDTALVLEAMAFYSVDTLTKAYYDITLKGRDLADEKSEEMLDIIFASRVYDLGFIYNFGGVGMLIEQMNAKNSSDFTSMYAAISDKVDTALQETLDSFED